jgi:uncharacterized protein
LKMGLPLRDDLSSRWLNAVKEAGAEDRLILFGSVQPKDADAPEELRMLKKEFDIIGVKLHPTMQQFAPDDPRAMALYEICEELDLMVFFHAGRAGIEPAFTQDYALLQNYVGAVSTFPNVPFVFGHVGARDYREAIAVAKAHANVWMELHGQGVSSIREMLAELGPEQLLFGTDWPWYPIAASLAKLLIVTEGDKTVRDMIFRENALRLLGGF